MGTKLNHEKLNRYDRVSFVPSPRSQPATQRQLDYIIGLAHRKGQPKPRLPKTKAGASDRIEQLLDLPDVNERRDMKTAREITPPSTRDEVIAELRECFPILTPMTANSLCQLFSIVDEVGMNFFFNELMGDTNTPDDLEDLVAYILREFLDWIS